MSKIDPIYAAIQKYREASAQLVALGEERDAEQESRLLNALVDDDPLCGSCIITLSS
jgi:hypothetical protein